MSAINLVLPLAAPPSSAHRGGGSAVDETAFAGFLNPHSPTPPETTAHDVNLIQRSAQMDSAVAAEPEPTDDDALAFTPEAQPGSSAPAQSAVVLPPLFAAPDTIQPGSHDAAADGSDSSSAAPISSFTGAQSPESAETPPLSAPFVDAPKPAAAPVIAAPIQGVLSAMQAPVRPYDQQRAERDASRIPVLDAAASADSKGDGSVNDTAAKSPLGTAAAAPLTLASGGPTIQRGPQTAPSSPLPEAASDQAEPPRPEGGASPAPREAAPATSAGLSALGGLSRATLETTAMMSAQIIRRLEMRSTRFEMALTPEGLGRVDVSLEIDGDGQLAARLAFDNPAAAAELRGRADELRRQLEQAGFQIGDGALEFAERDGQGQRENAFERAASRAFAGAGRLADTEAAIPAPRWISLTLAPEGVDMKV